MRWPEELGAKHETQKTKKTNVQQFDKTNQEITRSGRPSTSASFAALPLRLQVLALRALAPWAVTTTVTIVVATTITVTVAGEEE